MRVGDISEACRILRSERALPNLLHNLNLAGVGACALDSGGHFGCHGELVIGVHELVLATHLIRADHIVKCVVWDYYRGLLGLRYRCILLRLDRLQLLLGVDIGELKVVFLLKFI